jgi:hypothetical protein
MVRTIVLFIADNNSVHLTDYPGRYPSQLGIAGGLKGIRHSPQPIEEAFEKIKQIIEENPEIKLV